MVYNIGGWEKDIMEIVSFALLHVAANFIDSGKPSLISRGLTIICR